MTDSRVAQDPNRLPWLAEERHSRPRGEWTLLLLGALLSALVVAGVSFWLGAKNASEAEERARQVPAAPAPTPAPLPQPIVQPPRTEQVRPAPVPVVEPLPKPFVTFAPPEPVRKAAPPAPSKPEQAAETDKPAADTLASKPAVAKPAAAKPVAKSGPLRVWPATVSEGANGRVVRIGAFGSRYNAKKGWWQIVRRYPGMRRLKAVVAPVPAPRTGKIYYRLQYGTTSQAHSEVLCQRMRAIRKTCTVVGLPPRSNTQTKSVRR